MSEVSNRTLAALLVVAIVVSLGGTFVSLGRLGSLKGAAGITGMQTYQDTGKVNVTITQDLTIFAVEDNIWFGEGRVNTTASTYADLWSNGTSIFWVNYTQYLPERADADADYIIIQNDGNQHVNVSVWTNQNATEYLCSGLAGPSFDSCYAAALYKYWTVQNETGSCDAAQDEADSETPTDFLGNGDTQQQNVCGQLRNVEAADSVRLYAYLRIPDSVVGSKTDTLNFEASLSVLQS